MASVNVSTGANGSPTKCSSPNSTTTTTTTNTNPSDVIPDLDGDEDSLQKLIESEFAMRIAAVKETPPDDLLVGLQTDFFSTTQYESPSEEIPPTTDPFDPFATTVEQSPTFPGFSEEEVKEFNQDPMCGDLLSPTANTDNVLIDSITNENISTQANVDLLADLDPINDTIELSPSPPEGKNIMDEIESVEKLALIENSHPEILDNLELNEEFSRSDLKSDIKNLELSFQEQVLDPITQTIDISPSPPPENENELQNCIGSKVEEEEEDIIIPSPKIEEPMVDCINETIDLSPSPPIESTDNKKELTNGICDPVDEIISPSEEIVDPINETIDLSPSPPSDKIKDFQNQINEIEDVEKFDPINETIDLSPSPPAVDPIIADEVPEVADIIQDPMYQTYDLSPSPPVDNIAPIEEHPLNVEIVITEHEEVDTSAQLPVVDHFAPPMPTLEIDGFETWTVAGAEEEEDDAPPMQKSLLPERPTSLPHVVCADTTNTIESVGEEIVTPSSEETTSPSTETSPAKKKASKKTKSSGEVKTKKSKKTKKCEEKENISVAGLPPPDLLHEIQTSPRSLRGENEDPIPSEPPVKSTTGAMTLVPREELGNVSVKNLSLKFVRGPKATSPRTDMEELEGVSLRSLRDMYISEANKSFNGLERKLSTENIPNTVSINSLRRSFGDLSTLTDAETNGHRSISPSSEAATSPMYRKSYGTLPLPKTSRNKKDDRRNSATPSPTDLRARSYSDLSNLPSKESKEPIFTGVSVRALLASYCSVAHLGEEEIAKPRSRKSSIVSSPSSPPPQILPRSSFSKFDALSRKSGVLHVRSSDSAKAQQQFSQDNYPLYALLDEHESATAATVDPASQQCRCCGTQVFQMEQVKAEKAVWHKNCFRCKECNKQLTVDTYSSNEGQLYCKPHFKELFKPKAVAIEEPALLRARRPEMIIRENQPEELPPDVVRASDKPDLGLEELSALNVKSRFQVFERTEESNEIERSSSAVNVKRSPSILSKLARFQAKGMDVGVTDDSLHGIPVEESTSEEEEEEDEEGEDGEDTVVKAKVKRERPQSFAKMDDMRSLWATGQAQRREEQREERKEEVQKLRSRLFMPTEKDKENELDKGKCGKVKEMYEQAVQESSTTKTSSQQRAAEVRSEKARSIKERFEKGEIMVSDEEGDEDEAKKAKQEDLSVFEAEEDDEEEIFELEPGKGISKKSRSLFLELDSAAKSQQQSPQSQSTTPRSPLVKPEPRRVMKESWLQREPSQEVVRSSDVVEEAEIQTADISSRFKFFEGYREPEKKRKQFRITPPRDGQVKENSPDRPVYHDPDIVRADDKQEEEELVRSQTASRMLSLFRQMEEKAGKEEVNEGPKPLKRFTPPPDYKKGDSEGSEEEEEEEEESEGEESDEERGGEPGVVRASDKVEDDFLKQAMSTNAARAKLLRAKFEQWESSNAHLNGRTREEEEEDEEREGRDCLETTSSLRARFESLSATPVQPLIGKERPKVNRFVVPPVSEECRACEQRLYPMERLEAGGNLYHRKCFRCRQCNCILRLESFTVNQGNLYCLAHFRQLFIARGNYDEGFGKAAPAPPVSAEHPVD